MTPLATPLATTLSITLGVTLGLMLLLWGLSVVRQDASIVDPFWGMGFVVVSWIAHGLNAARTPRSWCLLVLVTIWGLRLSGFLLWRNWGHGEDRRYQAMRVHHGPRFWWVSLLSVFVLQGIILWFVSLPIQSAMVAQSTGSWGIGDLVGCLLWVIGWVFETVGDWQLACFKSDPANAQRVMNRGLWRFTRHPNYFGDFCVWWGLSLVAVSGGAGVVTILSPLLMSTLLLKVSGVTLLEKTIRERRPEYAEYQRCTNGFFPGPPRKPRRS